MDQHSRNNHSSYVPDGVLQHNEQNSDLEEGFGRSLVEMAQKIQKHSAVSCCLKLVQFST